MKLLLILAGILLLFFVVLNKSEEPVKKIGSPVTSVLTTNLEIPWSLVFLPDNRILVTERSGRVKLIDKDGKIVGDVITIRDVKHQGEGGLLGMALHPQFGQNRFVYLYYTFDEKGRTMNKVVRYKFNNDKLTDEKTLLDKIPGSFFHNGGRIKFGPDGFLYITTGDSQNESSSQDKNSLAGKILRMRPDGSSLEVYSYGHRNPQGLDWKDGKLYITEHGPSVAVFPNCCQDEINLIEKGGNYGWPQSVGDKVQNGTIAPVLHSKGDTWAPSGAIFYKDKLFFAGLKGQALYEYDLNSKSLKTHFKNGFGRIRDVVLGPDNLLYVLTNNRDGRGTQRSGDDKIIKVNPEKL